MPPDDFSVAVAKKRKQLKQGDFAAQQARRAEKRAAWARAWLAGHEVPPTPRGGFELFIRDYLGADLATVPVVAESDAQLVWRAGNPCDTLEACAQLGLQTREICRVLYEKPTQWLLSELDPELRFLRSYERIRPHADHCEERILRVSFDRLMDRALEAAHAGRARGGKGYGAVVALGDEILAGAHDAAAKDPTAHAELRALRAAAEATGSGDLTGAVLVTTCEPCPMCSGAAVWANVTTVVYGASIPDTAALGRTRIHLRLSEVVDRSPALVEIIGDFRSDDCLALYR